MLEQVEQVDAGSNSKNPPLDNEKIESRCREIGQKIFSDSRRYATGLFNRGYWQQRMMELTTANPRVKVQLFRFVDVLPVLKTDEQKKTHLLEYLSKPQNAQSWPMLLRMAALSLKSPLHPWVVKMADQQVKQMGEVFIIGQTPEEVLPKVKSLRSQRIGFTLDVLGEAVLSEAEAKTYRDYYDNIITHLGEDSQSWESVDPCDFSPLGELPKVNVSVKVSAFDPTLDPMAPKASIERLSARIEPLLREAMKRGIFINFDMEQFSIKDLTKELFMHIMIKPEFRSYRHFGIVNQAYLRDSKQDAEDWVAFAKERGTPFTIRLVKGAYWDYETILAEQNGWASPVYLEKWQSDENFEECARILLNGYPHIELAAASHNVRSLAYTMAYAEAIELPKNAFEIQMLYGMSGAFKNALLGMGMRIREYCPMGEMLPGLSYLVRRLLENTANDSFLKQSFLDKRGIVELLKKPGPSSSKV